MAMARLDERILGYHKGEVAPEDNCKLVNSMLRLDVCAKVKPSGEFSISSRDKAKLTAYLKSKIRFKLGKTLGLYGFLLDIRHRYGVLIGLVIITLFFAFSSRLVWDIRISGNERLSDYEIESALLDLDLHVGSRFLKIDKNAIETEMLSKNKDIAWISVNRRGTVVYVDIIESENIGLTEEEGYPFSNIVADRDGVIEEITVDSGIAAVKVGDVVKKGDILISGVIENERGVILCRASGSVRASGVIDVSAESLAEITEKTPKRHRLKELRLILFNFSINIFKNYGNSGEGCDIIRENRKIALFDKFRLPIKIEKAYAVEYAQTTRTRSHDEMTDVAKRELDGKIYSMFKDADILKLRTTGEFLDGVYRVTSRVVYSSDIGKESAIEIN